MDNLYNMGMGLVWALGIGHPMGMGLGRDCITSGHET